MANRLLIVDDDELLLQAISHIFKEYYDVRIAASGEEALEVLGEGFIPEVILTDQGMTGMSGTEFLVKSIELAPDSIRVILTGRLNVNEVITSVNDGHIYKFLTKPVREVELLYTIQECFHYYHLSMQNRQLVAELQVQNKNLEEVHLALEQQNAELQELNLRVNNHLVQIVRLLSSLVTADEQHYYTHHAQTVASIAHALATGMGLDGRTIRTTVLAALLHDIGKIGLPQRIMIAEYEGLGAIEQTIYQSHVEKGWQILRNIPGLEEVAKVVLQHHEHNNGTGFPAQLEEDEILSEAQIVSIANIYHNLVYKIPVDVFRNSANPGLLMQSAELISHRQAEAKKALYKRARHFRLDIFEAFIALIDGGTCPVVQPGVWRENPPAPLESMSRAETPTNNTDSVETSTAPKPVVVSVRQIEMGMIAAEDILTKEGTLVLPAGSLIDYHKFRKLFEFYESHSIPTQLLFFKPKNTSDIP